MKILIILFPLFSFLLIILNNFVISISLLQFKLEHHFTIKIDFNNINIKCKIIREDNENLEINFVPNSNASHLYQGEVCPNNEYVLTIKNNIINTKCPSPYRHNQGDEFVTLYKIMINTEGCKKDIRKTSTELIQTDFDFNNQSRGGFNNFDDLINLIDSKINFMNNYYTKRNEKRDFIFEDWQQLGQIYIIEYLINLPIFTQSVDFGIKLHDLNMLKCGFELIDPDHPVVEKWRTERNIAATMQREFDRELIERTRKADAPEEHSNTRRVRGRRRGQNTGESSSIQQFSPLNPSSSKQSEEGIGSHLQENITGFDLNVPPPEDNVKTMLFNIFGDTNSPTEPEDEASD